MNNFSHIIDFANLPLVDREDFPELCSKGVFNEYEKLAREIHDTGITRLIIEDNTWLQLIERINTDIDQLVNIKYMDKNTYVGRFQDAWLSNGIDSIRKLACHQEILNALKILYGRTAFPFQTLNFHKGSAQSVHSDATHFHSLPYGFMCGVWIALEDVSIDAGPLFYYPCSHRLPYLSSKDLNITLEQIESNKHPQKFFESSWLESIKQFDFKRVLFLAKRGEVIIWHANLLHGGSKIINNLLTRRSQVTHYYFRNCAYKRPFFDCSSEEKIEKKWYKPRDLTL
mgnify:CR=1 FL=1